MSRYDVGSSKKYMSTSLIKAAAIDTNCNSPPEIIPFCISLLRIFCIPNFSTITSKLPELSAFFRIFPIFPLTVFGSLSTYCGFNTHVILLFDNPLK